ncbi:SMI1/KNR4 family protein [Nocardia sp. NPDC051570]|uniref:SMI1/KNR4 family protein n=1 Tax=Nocardia sp. NPDC051570 TaxID=3364324 RepID=UPI0037A8714A
MALRDLVARAVALGATPGPPASHAELMAAELRLGVRFDAQYREFMSICSGIEGMGEAFLYSADELGASPRWLQPTDQLEIEYFEYPPTFEMRDGEKIDPIFHPPPADRTHVLIGETEGSSLLVCNFSISDPDAPPGDVADCRYEPNILGDITAALARLVDRAERLDDDNDAVDPARRDRARVLFQLGRLLQGVLIQNRTVVRHTLSNRWRHEFDRHPGQAGLTELRRAVLWFGTTPEIDHHRTEFDLWGPPPHSLRAPITFGSGVAGTPDAIVVGVVEENTVWRIDSWSWD